MENPEQQQEDLPVNLIPPQEFNIDPSTTRFAPLEYGGMLTQGLANWYGANVVPAAESIGKYWHNAMLPGGEQYDPAAEEQAQLAEKVKPAKESEDLIHSLDTGYADKSLVKPVQTIRESLAAGDYDAVGKAHRKLVEALTKNMSWGEKFADVVQRGGRMALADKIAADVIMKELTATHGTANEAVTAGVLQPHELMMGTQVTPQYAQIPPQPFQYGMPSPLEPMAYQQESEPSGYTINPTARLNPIQEDVVEARTKSQMYPQSGKEKSVTPSDLAMAGVKADMAIIRAKENREPTPEEQAKSLEHWTGTERKQAELELKQRLGEAKIALDDLHGKLYEARGKKITREIDLIVPKKLEIEARIRLADALAAYKQQEPALQERLQAMRSSTSPQHYVYQAIARVRDAIEKGQKPNDVDSALFESYLRHGQPEFGVTFLGKMYNRYTGKMVEPDLQGADEEGVLGWLQSAFKSLFGSTPPPVETGPAVGDVKGGYKFKGGDPSKQENWEKVK